MGFQKKAYVSQAIGKPGQKSRALPDHHLPKIVEGHDLKEGAFAFAGTSPDQVKGTALAGTSPIGFAALQRYQANLTGGKAKKSPSIWTDSFSRKPERQRNTTKFWSIR